MSTQRDKVLAFLDAQGLSTARIAPEPIVQAFVEDMALGLGDGGGALAMIPTFLNVDAPAPRNASVIVMDAGGTNLRVGTVHFDDNGDPEIVDYARHDMPGIDEELDGEAFFARMAEALRPYADAAESIGLCFSFPVEITPHHDGRLLHWTKEIKAPEVEGRLVGAGVLGALAGKGRASRITVLNDTVATLLAARSVGDPRQHESFVGLILGTGFNLAYVERNANILKRRDLPAEGFQVINIEAGNFGGMPRTAIDDAFDATTEDPGRYRLEKMVAGAYRGGLCRAVLHAAGEAGLLSAGARGALEAPDALSTVDVTRFLNNPFAAGPLSADAFGRADRQVAYRLCRAVVERAALAAAIALAAAALKSGAGRDPLRPICVNVDGSTFHRNAGFQSRVEAHLVRLLEPRDIHVKLVRINDAPFIGAAVAGLSA
jgi:hexokinase